MVANSVLPCVVMSPYHYPIILSFTNTVIAVGFEQLEYTLGEGDGPVMICARLFGVTERSIEIILSTEPNSAQGLAWCRCTLMQR